MGISEWFPHVAAVDSLPQYNIALCWNNYQFRHELKSYMGAGPGGEHKTWVPATLFLGDETLEVPFSCAHGGYLKSCV